MIGEDLAEVVDAGRLGGWSRRRRHLGVDVALDGQRYGEPELTALEPDLDPREILRSVAELDLTPDQGGVGLILIALEAQGGGPADATSRWRPF